MEQAGQTVSRNAHNVEIVGSTPTPATKHGKRIYAFRDGAMTEITHEKRNTTSGPLIKIGSDWNKPGAF